MTPLNEQTARPAADAFLAAAAPYPADRFRGRGIVVCGGGTRYFTCAWVCINRLRRAGCTLPIELWHLDDFEMDAHLRRLVAPLGVTCVNAAEVRRRHPARTMGGWEMKPYSILHSSFREVLSLDADNVTVSDPTYLFDSPQYLAHGAVFWPDFGRLAATRSIWRICGVEYRDEPEFESGQILVDKGRCWRPLQLTMHLNENSDLYYRHIHGDKDTFHMAWRMAGQAYAMVPYRIRRLPAVMCQHDFSRRVIFQHRNRAKWSLGGNRRIPGFRHEPECLEHLERLAGLWDGKLGWDRDMDAEEAALADVIVRTRRFEYVRVGHDRRPMELLPDGKIGSGSAGCEEVWTAEGRETGEVALVVAGRRTVTVRLTRSPDGVFRGRWLVHERMPVELRPLGRPPR